MISNLITLEPLTRKPRVLDVDDAIFLHGPEGTSRKLAQICDTVVCGNTFLAEWFSKWNQRTVVIPTAVDTEAYLPRHSPKTDDVLVIGWIGTSGNFPYLSSVEEALASVLTTHPHTRLRVVSDRVPKLPCLPAAQVEFVQWTEKHEVANIQGMDIGIMPLTDTPWARGKCSFKMLQYMACGLPVVVSPVGMNAEVLSFGESGIAASSASDWEDGLIALLEQQSLRIRMGQIGRGIAESRFSIPAIVPLLAQCLLGSQVPSTILPG